MLDFKPCPNDPDHEMMRNDADDGWMCPFCGAMVYDVEEADTEEEEEETLTKAEQLSEENGLPVEVNQAYIDNIGEEFATAEDVLDAYQGQWKNDEEFAEDLLTDTGAIPKDFPRYIYIDWERTASDIMMDYFEQDGYYFRNL